MSSGASSSHGPSSAAAGSAASEVSSSAADPSSYPVTVTANNGAVTIPARPHAIVSLSPTATETLYAIGAGAQVVAVDKQSDYPQGLPATRFDSYQLNIESIAKVDPDLVISSYLSDDQLTKFRALKIPVLLQDAPANIDGAYQQIDELGVATGHTAAATVLVAQMKEHVAKIVADVPHNTTSPTYYYELDQTFYSITSDTFAGSLLAMLGLHSIADSADGAAAAGGYPQLSAEFILKANPDYIFLTDGACCQQDAASIAARPGWSSLTAVKEGRVIALDADVASRWGPRVVDLLQTVATALDEHPARQ